MGLVDPPLLVLVHGLLGFSHIGPIAYFRGIEATTRALGLTVLIPGLPSVASIADRATVLARTLRDRSEQRFVLIGHSMGGLDARFVAAHLDPDHRVRAVITVATPHRGTQVAERILTTSSLVVGFAASMMRTALTDLTPSVRRDNPIPDRGDVAYGSYVACRPEREVAAPLRPFARMMQEPNDGLVPAPSAHWGASLGSVRADHFEIVGWSLGARNTAHQRPFDHIAFWRQAIPRAIATAP